MKSYVDIFKKKQSTNLMKSKEHIKKDAPFNNYVEGGGGQKMSVFFHT